MRPHIHEFFEKCAGSLPCREPIVEIGAWQAPGQEAIADLRPLFAGKKYLGCDMQNGRGVDQIEDIHRLSFEDSSVGTFLLADTLEHVLDPIRGMKEIHRCLAENGIAIFTSVMDFPIHAYPNDYWRFTPEAFRALAEPFPIKAIFYGGPARLPHTVCGIAAKAGVNGAVIHAMGEVLVGMRTPDILRLQDDAARLVHTLTERLAAECSPAKKLPKPVYPGGFGRFAKPGWYLVEGMPLEGWILADNVTEVEIMADGMSLGRAKLDRPRPDMAKKHGFPPERAVSFLQEARVPERRTWMGAVEMWAVDTSGKRTLARESAPGLVLGEIGLDPRLIMHSFDDISGSLGTNLDMTLRKWIERYQSQIVFSHIHYRGVISLKNVLDLWIIQEIIDETKPEAVIEIGVKHGGTTLWLSDTMKLRGDGIVISLDINRPPIEFPPNVHFILGDSIAPETVQQVKALCENKRTMVIADGNHAASHVLQEMRLYCPLISKDCYFISEDGIVDVMDWKEHTPGPMVAAHQFLAETDEFVMDRSREKFLITYAPDGFLRRVREAAGK
jgi:cephalosporin hydroxylase/SAM-dependent methyltransferase